MERIERKKSINKSIEERSREMLSLLLFLALWPSVIYCSYEYGGVIAGSSDGADGNIAKLAMLQSPLHIAFDSAGLLHFTDKNNHRVCKILSNGKLIVIAGNGMEGYSGDNGLAINSKLSHPSGLAIDSKGDIFISDFGNNRIRKITVKTGVITTIAGDVKPKSPEKKTETIAGNYGNFPSSFQFKDRFPSEYLFNSATTKKESTNDLGDNENAQYAKLDHPLGLAVDKYDNLYIADKGNNRVRKINARTNIISTIAGGDGTGNFGNKHFSGDGNLAVHAKLFYPADVAVDKAGNVYIADSGNNRIRVIHAKTGIIDTIAGIETGGFSDNKLAIEAKLRIPVGVDVDSDGNIFIADKGNNCIRKITKLSGVISTIAGTGQAGINDDKAVSNPESIMLNNPSAIALDKSGNVFIADTNNHRIRRLNVK